MSFEEICISNTGKDKAKLDVNTEIERNCFAQKKHREKKQKLDVNAELEKLFCPTKKTGKDKAKTWSKCWITVKYFAPPLKKGAKTLCKCWIRWKCNTCI